jgi:uncharacterized protein YjbJ (UPF0337 family)
MNKNRLNGTLDQVMGSAKRKAGKWTGNTRLQLEGLAQQVKGKLENALGKIEDRADDAGVEDGVQHDTRP